MTSYFSRPSGVIPGEAKRRPGIQKHQMSLWSWIPGLPMGARDDGAIGMKQGS